MRSELLQNVSGKTRFAHTITHSEDLALSQIKKIVFRVARLYLNLLVQPRFFQVFWKNMILCI